MNLAEIDIRFILLLLVPIGATWWNLRSQIKANGKAAAELFNLQKREQDARANIPAVIEILEDLADLHQAFVFRGIFIPGLEHRCPSIQLKDGETKDQMSVAERTHQLRLIARRIIRNCWKVVFLTPKHFMPKTVEICKGISKTWLSRNPGQRRFFESAIGNISMLLQAQCDHQGISLNAESIDAAQKACDAFAAELENYQVELEAQATEEFPTYAREKPLAGDALPPITITFLDQAAPSVPFP